MKTHHYYEIIVNSFGVRLNYMGAFKTDRMFHSKYVVRARMIFKCSVPLSIVTPECLLLLTHSV